MNICALLMTSRKHLNFYMQAFGDHVQQSARVTSAESRSGQPDSVKLYHTGWDQIRNSTHSAYIPYMLEPHCLHCHAPVEKSDMRC